MNKIVKWFRENILGNKRNFIIFIVLVVLFILVLLLLFNDGDVMFTFTDNDNILIKKEYEKLNGVDTDDGNKYPEVSLDSDNKFVYTDVSEILNIFNSKGDAVIYFGDSDCLYCRSAIQVLNDVAMDTELDKILYLNIDKKNKRYDELVGKLDDKFLNIDGDKKEIYSPLVLFVVDGEIVSYNKGTLFSQESPYDLLDNSQLAGLSEIYKYGIRDVIEGVIK